MSDPRSISFPCLRVDQPIGTFYIATVDCRQLRDIAFSDIRRIEEKEQRDVEKYLGIQRELKAKRVDEIKKYVQTADAAFPTSVIVAVDERCAFFDEEKNQMTLTEFVDEKNPANSIPLRNSAKILDGQHRLAGLQDFNSDGFSLNVSIFVGADMETQATIFSTVNLAQTKVNKSLVYDLFSLAKSRSPQKTCHLVAVALDQNKTSPFYKRIKRLGVATKGRYNETITQANFADMLMPYVSSDPMTDRDLYFKGKSPLSPTHEDLQKQIFRGFFINDDDLKIAEVLFNYFGAVRECWPTAWNNFGQGSMLNKTNGFRALMRVLRPLYLKLTGANGVPAQADFLAEFERSTLKDSDFNVERFKPGTSGESGLVVELVNQLCLATTE